MKSKGEKKKNKGGWGVVMLGIYAGSKRRDRERVCVCPSVVFGGEGGQLAVSVYAALLMVAIT